MAGITWLYLHLQRCKNIFFFAPQTVQYISCRAWGFNKENDKFFEITDLAHKKQQYTSYCVFIVDETGLTVDQNKLLDSVAAQCKR